jgi:DNA-binding NarL/FixJ family response regulator
VVCGEASSLKEAVEALWEPDLVVHELVLPEATGAPVVSALRARFPGRGWWL